MSDVVKLITTIGIVGASDHPAKATAERELQSVRDELFDLRQRVAELEADKARWDWLEKNEVGLGWPQTFSSNPADYSYWVFTNAESPNGDFEGATLRQALDAAMAQQKEGVK